MERKARPDLCTSFQKLEWQKVRKRNEALDCRVYARAAVWIAGADRWSEGRRVSKPWTR